MIADYYYYYYYSSHHYFGLRGVLAVARGGDADCVGVLLFPWLDTEGIEYAIGGIVIVGIDNTISTVTFTYTYFEIVMIIFWLLAAAAAAVCYSVKYVLV